MATERRYVITCDAPECPRLVWGESRYLARRTARDCGWNLAKDRDLCATHAPLTPPEP